MKRAVAALVFDFDGLILDTESARYHGWSQAFSRYGCTLLLEKWIDGISSDQFDPHEYLEELAGQSVDRDDLRKVLLTRFEELMSEQVILPGVQEYISAAKNLELKLGIASNSDRSRVASYLDRYGIARLFDSVVCGDDVSTGKPDPAVYEEAVSRLEVRADETIAFEDSPNGVLAAKRAGIFCVAVPSPVMMKLSFAHADIRLNSLSDLPLIELLARFVDGS